MNIFIALDISAMLLYNKVTPVYKVSSYLGGHELHCETPDFHEWIGGLLLGLNPSFANCHLPVVCPYTGHLTSLCLSYILCLTMCGDNHSTYLKGLLLGIS